MSEQTVVSPEMELLIVLASASVLGTKAFMEGKSCVPAHNKEFFEFLKLAIKGKPFGYSIPIFDAYTSAWHQANVAAEPLTQTRH